jgi:hypothetical protein
MPLVKAGIPAEPVQMENIVTAHASKDAKTPANFLDRYKVLLLTYEGQKPPTPAIHDGVVQWVKNGGALIVVDNDTDPFNQVREWWNTGDNKYATPRQHLFDKLGLAPDFTGTTRVGRGLVTRLAESPAHLAHTREGATTILQSCQSAAQTIGVPWEEAGGLILRRGPYVVAAGIGGATRLTGRYIDLFADGQPVVTDPEIAGHSRRLLVDLARVGPAPKIAAAAGRVTQERVDGQKVTVKVEGVQGTQGAVRLLLPAKPTRVSVNGTVADATWDNGVAGVAFPNQSTGSTIEVEW